MLSVFRQTGIKPQIKTAGTFCLWMMFVMHKHILRDLFRVSYSCLCIWCHAVFNGISTWCSPPEHEWRHGSAAQAADGPGCERQVHRRAGLRVHPRMHCVRPAGHPSLPRLAGWPPGEMNFTHRRWCVPLPWETILFSCHPVCPQCIFRIA